MTNSNGNSTTLTTVGPDIFQISLLDEDGQNILGIDDGALRQSLRIEIVNTSGKDIEFQSLNNQPSVNNYHFCISFRPGTLLLPENEDENPLKKTKEDENPLKKTKEDENPLKKTDEGWPIKRDQSTFYLLSNPANPSIKKGEKITLTLKNIGAAPGGGSRGTRVEIKYNNLKYQGSNGIISGNRLQYLNIVNQRGKKQIPLYVGFVGSNTILNDGTENELILSIQSIPNQVTALTFTNNYQLDLTNTKTTRWKGNIVNFLKEKVPNYLTIISQSKEKKSLNENVNKFFTELEKSLTSQSVENSNSTTEIFQSILSGVNLNNEDKKQIIQILIQDFNYVSVDDLNSITAVLKNILSFEDDSRLQDAIKEINSLKVIEPKSTHEGSLRIKGLDREALLDQVAKLTISFDVAKTKQDFKHWALVEKTNADDISIIIKNGQENWVFVGKEEQGITPQWNFVCKKGLELKDRREILRLNISNLKTKLLAGYANLYVHYENIPGYWDGYITVPIHKGPLVYRETTANTANNVKVSCVGIGTDEPQAKLHVKSANRVDGLKVEGNTEIAGALSVSNGKVGIDKVGIDIAPGSEQLLKVQGNTEIAGNLSVFNGNVGIGTVSPQDRLHIKGGSLRIDNGNGSIRFDNGQIQTWGPIILTPDTDKLGNDKYVVVKGDLAVEGGSIRLDNGEIKSEGKIVLAPDTNNSGKNEHVLVKGHLAVEGQIWSKNYGNFWQIIKHQTDRKTLNLWGGNNGSGDFPSDIKLKKEISPIPNSLSQIEQIQPVSFYWQDLDYFLNKFDEDYLEHSMLNKEELEILNREKEIFKAKLEKQQFGFIAQDLETVFPDWVSTCEAGYKQINLRMLPSFLVGAIQELKKLYDELAMKNKQLQKRIETLEYRD